MNNLDRASNEYQIESWKDNSEEWSPRGSYRAGFNKALSLLKAVSAHSDIEGITIEKLYCKEAARVLTEWAEGEAKDE